MQTPTANRLVVLDTETTGLEPENGHRIIEIGCVEIINRRLTGRHFHVYLNPHRLIDQGAIAVHGLTNEFLANKPAFADVAKDFIDFVNGSELIIHNAPFDVGFLNYELALLNNQSGEIANYCTVFDTLVYARKKHAGQRNSLDALCKRYNVDNSNRELHGALLDAQILADLFLIMTGGQFSLIDETTKTHLSETQASSPLFISKNRPALNVIFANDEELQAHQQTLDMIQKISGNCVW